MPGGIIWYPQRVAKFVVSGPVIAHQRAAALAAGVGARAVNSKATGQLARDVSRPKPVAPMTSLVGSDLPYARIQNEGGTIRPKSAKKLLIRAPRVGAAGQATRSTFGGEIVAAVDEVTIPAKHYLDAVVRFYPPAFIAELRRAL